MLFSRISALLLLAAVLFSCGKSKDPVLPAVTPTPTGTPTAPPTASPSPLPGMSCGVPPAEPAVYRCVRETAGLFVKDVNQSVAQVQREHPEMFRDLRIVDIGGFRVELIKNIEARGLCAVVDKDEIAVKNQNGFSEQYHVELSTGGATVRTGPETYRATCRPATFPIDPTPFPPRGDCPLPTSTEFACARLPVSQFHDLVWAAVDDVKAARPELFRADSLKNIGETRDFYEEVVTRVRDQGFCAYYDGHELAIKNTSTFSEQYHLVLSSKQLRRGFDSYRVTCKPAAF